MTARPFVMPMRRGACPGLSAPMPTGDGLLVRLQPIGTIPLDAFGALCRAARRHGNGVIEVTSRGSLQVRGLSNATAPRFAADIAALDIAADDGIPVLCDPLAGIDVEEIFDGAAFAPELRRALAQRSLAASLSPKVSVAIDGGGALGHATLPADIRLRAQRMNGEVVLRVAIGGDEKTASDIGSIDPVHGIEAVVRLLDVIARHGCMARAREIDIVQFRAAIADVLRPDRKATSLVRGNERDVIGTHALRDGSLACGIGLAFGHADAAILERLVQAATAAGAKGLRAAPRRALIAIGLSHASASAFTVAAEKLGFFTRADDPRRRIIACAGAPVCAAAHIAARALAPAIADRIAALGDDAFTVHVSGCAKGCAHAAPVALTVVGTPDGCAFVADGTARDAPFVLVSARDLSETIMRFARRRRREAAHV